MKINIFILTTANKVCFICDSNFRVGTCVTTYLWHYLTPYTSKEFSLEHSNPLSPEPRPGMLALNQSSAEIATWLALYTTTWVITFVTSNLRSKS